MRKTGRHRRKNLTPPLVVIIGFLSVISAGTILLLLPWSTASGKSPGFITALFTATSATCVTGLIVVDTGSYFSLFGQSIILALIQLGGLGIMTLSTAFTLLLGRKMTVREKVILGDVFNYTRYDFLQTLLKSILLMTIFIEALGFLSFYISFARHMPRAKAAYFSLFHSISAFCNAGFSTFSDSFMGMRTDVPVNLTLVILIVLGGVGFTVLLDLRQLFFWRRPRKFSFHTRLVLSTTAFLTVLGAVLIFFFEFWGPLSGLGIRDKIFGAIFQSVTARTAGFSTLPISSMNVASLFLIINLMFIGASPGSTGGGIKTTTFAIVASFIRSMVKDRDDVEVYKRTVPRRVVHRAISVFALGIMLIFTCTFILCVTERSLPLLYRQHGLLVSVMFEATSAFGTVGLSTGITPHLSTMGKLIITLAMFIGRTGPLTLALAIGLRESKTRYRYPEMHIMVG